MLQWRGFYMQDGNARPMQLVTLVVELQAGGSISGGGSDEVGVFRLEGCFHP
jgi:hypothetical protein